MQFEPNHNTHNIKKTLLVSLKINNSLKFVNIGSLTTDFSFFVKKDLKSLNSNDLYKFSTSSSFLLNAAIDFKDSYASAKSPFLTKFLGDSKVKKKYINKDKNVRFNRYWIKALESVVPYDGYIENEEDLDF